MNTRAKTFLSSLRRVVTVVLLLVAGALIVYALWRPGLDVRDGRHDVGKNAVWLAHGWLGSDEWFMQTRKRMN